MNKTCTCKYIECTMNLSEVNNWTNATMEPSADMLYMQEGYMDDTNINRSAIIGILVIIEIFGIIGNSVVIYLIASDTNLHKAPMYFLVCSSLTDLCRTVFCVPFMIAAVYRNFAWTFGNTACTVLAFTNTFFSVATCVMLLALVIDRYMSLTAPRMYSKCSCGFVTIACIILGWGIAFILSFPPVFIEGAFKFVKEESQCTVHQKPYGDNETLGYAIPFVIIVCAILFFYCRMFRFMRAHRRMTPLFHQPARSDNWTFFGPGANGQALINLLNGFTRGPVNPFASAVQNMQRSVGRVVNLRVIKNEHLSRLFFISSIVFIVSWTPYLFYVFVNVFHEEAKLRREFILGSAILSQSYLGICPLVYLLIGSPLRDSIYNRSVQWRNRRMYIGVSSSHQKRPVSNIKTIELEV